MEVCCNIVAEKRKTIGDPGQIVEINDGLFGKRKYKKGRFILGQMVLVGICMEAKMCFFVPV